jgi:hypothetical protein
MNSANTNTRATNYSVNIRRFRERKNIFTDTCKKSGILETKPELDEALYIAFDKVVQPELCNIHFTDHLDFQAKRGVDYVRYILNFDPKTRKYKHNFVDVITASGYKYKIIKSQFFLDKNIRDVFFTHIANYYEKCYHQIAFEIDEVRKGVWKCAVVVFNPNPNAIKEAAIQAAAEIAEAEAIDQAEQVEAIEQAKIITKEEAELKNEN